LDGGEAPIAAAFPHRFGEGGFVKKEIENRTLLGLANKIEGGEKWPRRDDTLLVKLPVWCFDVGVMRSKRTALNSCNFEEVGQKGGEKSLN